MSHSETGYFWRLCAKGNIEAVRKPQQQQQQEKLQWKQQQNFQVRAAIRVGRDVNERKGDGSTGLVSIILWPDYCMQFIFNNRSTGPISITLTSFLTGYYFEQQQQQWLDRTGRDRFYLRERCKKKKEKKTNKC